MSVLLLILSGAFLPKPQRRQRKTEPHAKTPLPKFSRAPHHKPNRKRQRSTKSKRKSDDRVQTRKTRAIEAAVRSEDLRDRESALFTAEYTVYRTQSEPKTSKILWKPHSQQVRIRLRKDVISASPPRSKTLPSNQFKSQPPIEVGTCTAKPIITYTEHGARDGLEKKDVE